ncbi:metallo-beta-lactamase domain-containing protein 1 [Dermatophagoides pteronyssinus]|uniref:Metallo-beta-lactamase domain-containing protein 1 n=1 Tax=Dermatophagoides pteronyssinus TaxID=6956 RepID=A0ABQ8JJR1_DERPT|nr:hypothetical protein DERP_008092 [Dermatophagoides pteronyssinus]
MSNQVIVLQDGYSRWHTKPNSMLANGSSTLIRLNNGQNIIVDTLGPWARDELIKLLQNNHMTTDDISMVIGTHLHTDHIGNLNLFPNAAQIVGDQRSSGDYFEFDIFRGQRSLQLTENVDLISTPGHMHNDVSVICHNVERLGTVAIVGDLFESYADLKNEQLWIDAGSMNPTAQRINRDYILSIADYIVPGHGGMFKV